MKVPDPGAVPGSPLGWLGSPGCCQALEDGVGTEPARSPSPGVGGLGPDPSRGGSGDQRAGLRPPPTVNKELPLARTVASAVSLGRAWGADAGRGQLASACLCPGAWSPGSWLVVAFIPAELLWAARSLSASGRVDGRRPVGGGAVGFQVPLPVVLGDVAWALGR